MHNFTIDAEVLIVNYKNVSVAETQIFINAHVKLYYIHLLFFLYQLK